MRDTLAAAVPRDVRNDGVIGLDSFKEYICPIPSTDYAGLEKIDPRLADRAWRLNNLYWVVDENGHLVRFKLRPPQIELLRTMHFRNIILKARQLGFSTFICIFLLDYALFNKNRQIGIIAQGKDEASVMFRKVKIAWDNFPKSLKEFLGAQAIGDSAVEYEFTNGSVMRVATSLRSGTYHAVLISEFGKICAHYPEKGEEIITGTLPAIPAGGICFIESTAEGEGGRYWEMVMDAMKLARQGRPLTTKDFKFFFFPWYDNISNQVAGDLELDMTVTDYLDKLEKRIGREITKPYRNWYQLELAVQKSKMKQEHPSWPEEAFLSTGNKLFDSEVVEQQRQRCETKPIEIRGDFLIYRRYVRGHIYGLGADVSQGVSRDSSTIVVIDFTTGEVVATYQSSTIDPILFAHDIKKIAIEYGGCIAAPEANTVGQTTCIELRNIYENIYTQVREGMLEDKPTAKLGWLSTGASKPRMMYELSEAMATFDLKVLDAGILSEAKMFNKEDSLETQVTPSTTRHFDLLIAAGIAWQMRIYASRGKADPADVAKVEERRETNLHRTKSNYR